ncbi:hypothetical protein P9112_005207 [Eukaryota sp. TZLM1-RC]
MSSQISRSIGWEEVGSSYGATSCLVTGSGTFTVGTCSEVEVSGQGEELDCLSPRRRLLNHLKPKKKKRYGSIDDEIRAYRSHPIQDIHADPLAFWEMQSICAGLS